MPTYIVDDTEIRHGKKGEKEASTYGPGSSIELTEAEAAPLLAAGRIKLPLPQEPEKKKR